ncbi:MAG: lipopolysaccharide heptosyltransferase II [Candidatus Nitricoxidivorans perseverans]|uniref:lipopolysaccharide heptosyltransferase II n=1 Tax=Candidatus Nitricoxidivorans perseverans TaxID=2975601 RepID=A0AA49FP03_9PROT|nr:MAG: lipopolysaccharide heptosyltransferase II [Candidatus Nitricoxidivorans perseverans]
MVAPSWIGDTIMMQPLLMRLHARHPDLALDALAPAWCAPLLLRMPEVRQVVENPFAHGEFNWAARRALGRTLARQGYDEAYVLPNSWKSALAPFFAGIPKRTGYTGEARFWLLNDRRTLDKTALSRLVDRYVRLAGPGETPPPRLTSTPAQQAVARAALGLPADASPVVFCPGAEYGPAKRWPARHYADLARRLATADSPVWLVGSPKDVAICEEIGRLAGPAVTNLCGRTTLEQAIDLVAGARAVVSNDSGLMHVAAALDRPLVALFGSSSHNYTPPLSSRSRILSLDLECSPCFQRTCPHGHLRCLEDLAPERVLAALDDLK